LVVELSRGLFLLPDADEIRKECQIRGVSFEVISDGDEVAILNEISSPSQNMESVILEKHLKLRFIHQKNNLGMMQLLWC
jgi:hypothetical protein